MFASLAVSMEDDRDWVDVAVLHEPEDRRGRRRSKGFEAGVGLSGYERGTGDEVIRDPALKQPREKEPVSKDLF